MDSIDKLLAALDAIDNPKITSPCDRVQNLPPDLSVKSSKLTKSNEIDDLLNRVKQDFEQKKVAEINTEKIQIQQQQFIKQKPQQQRKSELEKKAHNWLKNLDPLSGEGIWFMDFARNFPSPLEAAIVYLEPHENNNI